MLRNTKILGSLNSTPLFNLSFPIHSLRSALEFQRFQQTRLFVLNKLSSMCSRNTLTGSLKNVYHRRSSGPLNLWGSIPTVSQLQQTRLLVLNKLSTMTSRNTILRSLKNGYYKRNPEPIIIWGIISVNTMIFLAWQYASNLLTTLRDHSAMQFMYRNFTLGKHSLNNWWTFITCHFSHRDLFHFGINMFVFHSFGTTVSLIKNVDVSSSRGF